MSKQLALVAEGKRLGLIVVLAALLAALAAVGAPMFGSSAYAATGDLCGGLYHVNPDGSLATGTYNGTCTPAAADPVVPNNVLSYTHEVCMISANGIPLGDAAAPNNTSFGHTSDEYFFQVVGLGSGPAPLNGQVLPNITNATQLGNWNSHAAVCATWTAGATGDQQILFMGNDNNPIAGAALSTTSCETSTSGQDRQTAACTPLIKEWNVLSPTTITASAATSPQATDPSTATSGLLTNTTVNGSLLFNPANSAFDGFSDTYYENVWGNHTPNNGSQTWYLVAGAQVTFTATGLCGDLVLDPNDTGAFLNGTVSAIATNSEANNDRNVGDSYSAGDDIDVGESVTVTSVGASIPFGFQSDSIDDADSACTQLLGSNTGVSISVAYPNPSAISSGPVGVPPAEILNINWKTPPPAVKQVLLAWAGQTVILEHDWRIPAGDDPQLNPAGACAFWATTGEAFIQYVRQDGPGSFVGGLDAVTLFQGGEGAIVDMTGGHNQQGDAPDEPQNDCISRALYESEDQGEVDIVAYQTLTDTECIDCGQIGIGTGTDNQTQYPFVIYYMNLNTVDLTTVAATKPTHNSSAAPDWTPSNPWDASAETDTATSNVSADVLVRGRVTGWFTNSIPSGRAADSANHLPADRWVMPDDWAELAGGSLGTSFRPSYDLMFSPSNTGLALTSPEGNLGTVQVSVALTGSGTGSLANNNPNAPLTASPILVASNAGLFVGESILVGAQGPVTILAIVPISGVGYGIFTYDPVHNVGAVIIKPAAGTPIYAPSDGVPFEGPYSLIDIPGLAVNNGGIAGAALSNLAGGTTATRDTVLGDGQIDWWDAPMPPANISVSIRGAGFIKQVIKSDVYYLGAANSAAQTYPNPYYISNIPDSPYLPANVAGGSYLWDSWGQDGPAADGGIGSSNPPGLQGEGPYTFWNAVIIGGNELGIGETQSATLQKALADARADYDDDSIARDLTIFSDNHGEFMVAANGDVNLDYSGCSTNSLAGGHECKPGDAVGTGTVTAVADYPMLKKHAPIGSNAATIDWTWGGYKSVTIEKDPAGNAQFVYVVFHALDRDGHCGNADGAVLLHSALTGIDSESVSGIDAALGSQLETVDFKIDSGDGIVLATSGPADTLNDSASFATGVYTYSLAAAKAKVTGTPTTYFPMDAANAADGQTDECQAWIKVSNSLLGQTNVLTIAHDDEGNIGFDRVLDFQQTQDYTLNFRWTLFTWAGADNIPVADALSGGADTKNPQGNDITDQVTAIYGWQADTQTWLGYFPSGVDVPGANDLTSFHTGQAYWIAIKGPGNVTWTITTNVS